MGHRDMDLFAAISGATLRKVDQMDSIELSPVSGVLQMCTFTPRMHMYNCVDFVVSRCALEPNLCLEVCRGT